MLGTANKPKLRTKAAETKCLVPFCIEILGKYNAKVGARGDVLRRAGECLRRFDLILEKQPRVVPRAVTQDLRTSYRYLFPRHAHGMVGARCTALAAVTPPSVNEKNKYIYI
jgi:hypothetical protein